MKSAALLLLLATATLLLGADRVALVIDNDAYAHARPLGTAFNDASAVAGTLQKLGFETLVTPNAGLERIVEALDLLKAKAAGASPPHTRLWSISSADELNRFWLVEIIFAEVEAEARGRDEIADRTSGGVVDDVGDAASGGLRLDKSRHDYTQRQLIS